MKEKLTLGLIICWLFFLQNELAFLLTELGPLGQLKKLDLSQTASGPATPPPDHTSPRRALRLRLVERYSLSEIRVLCFDLGLEYDRLPGETRDEKGMELIAFMERNGRFDELLQFVTADIQRRHRPTG